MPAWHRANPIAQPTPRPLPLPEGGGHRNAAPIYAIPDARVVYQFIPEMPLRVSALRGLGGTAALLHPWQGELLMLLLVATALVRWRLQRRRSWADAKYLLRTPALTVVVPV